MSNKRKRLQAQEKSGSKYRDPDEPVPDYNSKNPIFSFVHMKYRGEYCVTNCEHKEGYAFLHHLVKISQLTWKEIISSGRKELGYEHIPIRQFHPTTVPSIITEDVTNLVVFAYSHGGRMAGIRDRDTFHIVFVGENLYDH